MRWILQYFQARVIMLKSGFVRFHALRVLPSCSMTYSVKEIFYSLQGEGHHAGRPAVFCRFSGCNLWSGDERQRAAAECNFCDTDFVGVNGIGGGKFADATKLAQTLSGFWPAGQDGRPYVVFTGGEPLLQLDTALVGAMHDRGFEVAVESNGTLAAPPGIDWLCVSPKGSTRIQLTSGNELKLVYPQPGVDPAAYLALDFGFFYLQPMARAGVAAADELEPATLQACVDYCLDHPRWQMSLQIHKLLAIR